MNLAALTTLVALLAGADEQPPPGWFIAGRERSSYAVTHLTTGTCSRNHTVRLASTTNTNGNATVMQVIDAARYLKTRVRFAATVRAENVTGWGGLWMRVDGAEAHHSLSFDNMQNRPLTGTLPCTRVSVVLDVTPEARQVALGLLLEGEGSLEMTDVDIAVVGEQVPVTRLPGEANDPKSVTGRVGSVAFNDSSIQVGNAPGQVETVFQLASPGRWSSKNGSTAILSGHQVAVKLRNPQPSFWMWQPGVLEWLEGTFEVASVGDVTTLTGSWGPPAAQKLPVKIRLSHEALELELGDELHRFVADPSFKVELGCVRFVLAGETGPSPIVCGDVLEPGVGTVQKTVALLVSCVQLNIQSFGVGRPARGPGYRP